MTKTDLIQFVKHQTNIELANDKGNFLNNNRKILYTQITRNDYYSVGRLLLKKGLRVEYHIKDYYWIYLS